MTRCYLLACCQAIIEESKRLSVPVHRVSQGSGIFLMPKTYVSVVVRGCMAEAFCRRASGGGEGTALEDGTTARFRLAALCVSREFLDMMRIGRDHRIEVCLFVGPRNAWDISATARTGESCCRSVSCDAVRRCFGLLTALHRRAASPHFAPWWLLGAQMAVVILRVTAAQTRSVWPRNGLAHFVGRRFAINPVCCRRRLRPRTQLAAGLEDVRWAVDHGLRSVLVADLGLLAVLGELIKLGKLPKNLRIKVSVAIGPQNPVRPLGGALPRPRPSTAPGCVIGVR